MNDQIDDKLMADAAKLSTEVRPQRDLWPEIEASIQAQQRKPRSPIFAQAAAVLLLVGASSGVTYMVMKNEQPTQVAVSSDYVFDRAAFGGSHSLGPGFTDARSGLASKLNTQLERLSPEDRKSVEDNLAVIRQAIDDINAELVEDPDNAHLQALLLKTYREELALMRKIGDLTQNVMSRNDI